MSGKTIKLNPEFLKLTSGKNKKDGTRNSKKVKPAIKNSVKPNKLRRELLQRIKKFQEKNENNPETIKEKKDEPEEEFQSEFGKSLNFLQNLTKKKRGSNKNSTLKKVPVKYYTRPPNI